MKNTEYLSNGMGGIVLSAKEAQDVLRTSPAYEEYLSLTEDFRQEILDIIVELESGALANVEIQKVGYRFPGQRSACYSSDLIIRRYGRKKSRTFSEKSLTI